MSPASLRVALFSGNYNYTRDGAAQSLQRLVDYLLQHGAAVRIYSPTVEHPAFPPNGELIHVPSLRVPTRAEYRIPVMLPPRVKQDLKDFGPTIFHVASPDILGHRAVTLARSRGIPVVASVHTRFETYARYYGLSFLEPYLIAGLRRFYRRCDAIFAPSASMARLLREQRMNHHVGIWTRGIDHSLFNPARRDMAWRRGLGIADDEPVVGFVGRIVLEKGLEVFAGAIDKLRSEGVRHRVVVIGDGPARSWFEARLPGAVFAGFQQGPELARAVASTDIMFNPSPTETFGNVTLEAMASGVAVVAAAATGSETLVRDQVSGRLVAPDDVAGFADALAFYCTSEFGRRSAGAEGRRLSCRFEWNDVNAALVRAYLRTIRQHGSDRRPPDARAIEPARSDGERDLGAMTTPFAAPSRNNAGPEG